MLRVRASQGKGKCRMSKKILVADDDTAMLKIYAKIFANTDHTIATASSFAEAAGLIKVNNYDLLITDLLLQDGIGTDLIKLLKEKAKGAKSMLVTGSVHEADPALLPEIYFEKPFNLGTFLAAVEAALGNTDEDTQAAI